MQVVLNTVVTMFAGYASERFSVEPVDVVDALGRTSTFPRLASREMEARPAISPAPRHATAHHIAAVVAAAKALNSMQKLHAPAPTPAQVSLTYVNGCTGLSLAANHAAALLSRMQLPSTPCAGPARGEAGLRVTVPPTRSDVLHACDVMEDVAIAFGFNRIPTRVPPTVTVGRALPLNALSDLLRLEVALAGFTEVRHVSSPSSLLDCGPSADRKSVV